MRINFRVLGIMVLVAIMSSSPGAAQTSDAKSVTSLDVTVQPDLNSDLVGAVQSGLQAKGMSPGRIDGKYGARTTAAVRAFQERYGMKPHGKVDIQLLLALGLAELAVDASR